MRGGSVGISINFLTFCIQREQKCQTVTGPTFDGSDRRSAFFRDQGRPLERSIEGYYAESRERGERAAREARSVAQLRGCSSKRANYFPEFFKQSLGVKRITNRGDDGRRQWSMRTTLRTIDGNSS